MSDGDLPEAGDILAAHEEIEEAYDLKHRGARVAAPRLDLKGIIRDATAHDDLYERAAFLLRKLITSHLFEDGNKRTAWAVTRAYLDQAGPGPAVTGKPVERVLRRIRRYEVDEIAEWLDTGHIDEDRLEP